MRGPDAVGGERLQTARVLSVFSIVSVFYEMASRAVWPNRGQGISGQSVGGALARVPLWGCARGRTAWECVRGVRVGLC